ncbi:MAG: AmmeMemoRadiSam system protein A, partial [Pseudomonadota bacterium]|nr:AmmeMemoRadiSam system protein A [Pseudomonadota bacterium]
DPRFTPVSADELQQLQLQISILTQPQPLPAMPEEQLLNFLTPGRDGLVLHEGSHRATFLPAVWESLPTPQHFLQELKRKAGLPSEYWSETMKFETYRTICFGE